MDKSEESGGVSNRVEPVVGAARLSVPYGWTRGEDLVVGKTEVHYRPVWFLEQSRSIPLCISEPFNTGSIALKWFKTKEDCFNFLVWWHEAH